LGIAPRTLSRGVYQLASAPMPANPELVVLARRVPRAVVCLISALHFHHLTAEVPHYLYIALPKGSPQPKLNFPALDVIRLSGRAMTSGVDVHTVEGEQVRVFNAAKTVVDCFRFRNKIGIDFAVEALREGLRSRKATPAQIDEYAKINRVGNVIRPYIEALV
jgi:predicted transcriptional regulator of viral defense system